MFLAISEGSPYVRMCHTISTYSAPFGVSDPDLNEKTVALVGETQAGYRPAMLELGDQGFGLVQAKIPNRTEMDTFFNVADNKTKLHPFVADDDNFTTVPKLMYLPIK